MRHGDAAVLCNKFNKYRDYELRKLNHLNPQLAIQCFPGKHTCGPFY